MNRNPNCTLCKLHETANTVCMLGRGYERADVMVIGEAPGQREDRKGQPFVGFSGELLADQLATIGLSTRNAYLTNAVNCRPPDNRTPSKREVDACRKWLKYQIAMVKPKYVLLLGNTPLLAALGETGIRKKRGKPVEKDGIIYLPTYHPAYILRDPKQKFVWDKDFRTFRDIIDFGGIPEEEDLNYVVVDTWSRVRQMLDDLEGTVSSDLETTRLYPFKTDNDGEKDNPHPRIVSIGFGTRTKQWIIPGETAGIWNKAELKQIVDKVTKKLESCFLVGHNWKFDALWMKERFDVDWVADFDTMLAHYLLDENDFHGLKGLAMKFCGAPDWDIEGKEKTQWSPSNNKYHAHDLYYTRKLRFVLGKMLNKEPRVKDVFKHILMPCSRLFTEVEHTGVYIDQSQFGEAEEYLIGELEDAQEELSQFGDINWGSPKQLGELLFGKLKIPILEKTKKGKPSTSESVIKRIDHPCAGALLKFRGAKQQLSFFINGWKPYLSNGWLHPSFKLHGTVTGRLSAEHPNLQQVPRDPRIRSLISAPKGWVLLEADLSQIELRIAAELANERAMLHAFINGIDVHWLTAINEISRAAGMKKEVIHTAEVWLQRKGITYGEAIEALLKMGPDEAAEINPIWKEVRKKAKAINFGYLYGMWWKKFKIYARDNYGVNVTDEQAQQSREAFFSKYKYNDWHKDQRRIVRLRGYVESLSGRKRRLPRAKDRRDTPERREAERQAINSPVQSFANELNLMAALQIRKEYDTSIVRIVGTVHDAILMMVKEEHIVEVHNRVLEIMSHPELLDTLKIELKVPILAEAKIGPWGKGLSLKKYLEARKTSPASSMSARVRLKAGERAGGSTTSSTSRSYGARR